MGLERRPDDMRWQEAAVSPGILRSGWGGPPKDVNWAVIWSDLYGVDSGGDVKAEKPDRRLFQHSRWEWQWARPEWQPWGQGEADQRGTPWRQRWQECKRKESGMTPRLLPWVTHTFTSIQDNSVPVHSQGWVLSAGQVSAPYVLFGDSPLTNPHPVSCSQFNFHLRTQKYLKLSYSF